MSSAVTHYNCIQTISRKHSKIHTWEEAFLPEMLARFSGEQRSNSRPVDRADRQMMKLKWQLFAVAASSALHHHQCHLFMLGSSRLSFSERYKFAEYQLEFTAPRNSTLQTAVLALWYRWLPCTEAWDWESSPGQHDQISWTFLECCMIAALMLDYWGGSVITSKLCSSSVESGKVKLCSQGTVGPCRGM